MAPLLFFYIVVQSALLFFTFYRFDKQETTSPRESLWDALWADIRSVKKGLIYIAYILFGVFLMSMTESLKGNELYEVHQTHFSLSVFIISMRIGFLINVFLIIHPLFKGQWLDALLSIIPGTFIVMFLIIPTVTITGEIYKFVSKNEHPLDTVVNAYAVYYVSDKQGRDGSPVFIPYDVHNESGRLLWGMLPIRDKVGVTGIEDFDEQHCIKITREAREKRNAYAEQIPGCPYNSDKFYRLHLKGTSYKGRWYVKEYTLLN